MTSQKVDILKGDLLVIVRDCNQTLFQGGAVAVTANNDIGPFDVLLSHANFVSPIKDYVVVHTREGKPVEFKTEKGVIRVKDNKAEVFVGI